MTCVLLNVKQLLGIQTVRACQPTAIIESCQPGPDTSAATIGQITVTSFTCYWPENAATSKCWIAKHNNILLAYHPVTIHFNVLLSTQVIPALRRVLWATQNWKVFCIKVMFFVSSIKVIPFVGKQIYTETKL